MMITKLKNLTLFLLMVNLTAIASEKKPKDSVLKSGGTKSTKSSGVTVSKHRPSESLLKMIPVVTGKTLAEYNAMSISEQQIMRSATAASLWWLFN
jgi:hypothetical protein